jgi:hypothetical protein
MPTATQSDIEAMPTATQSDILQTPGCGPPMPTVTPEQSTCLRCSVMGWGVDDGFPIKPL